MFIAAYRIAFDGWTAEQAVDEMREFHYLEFWHPGMKRYVEEFPERLARSPRLANFRRILRHDHSLPFSSRFPIGTNKPKRSGYMHNLRLPGNPSNRPA